MSSQSSQRGTDGSGAVVCQRNCDETERVTTNIVLALDSVSEFDAETSEEVLFDHIDPDALDALFQSASGVDRTQGVVKFTVADYEVSVSAQGDIVVRGPST